MAEHQLGSQQLNGFALHHYVGRGSATQSDYLGNPASVIPVCLVLGEFQEASHTSRIENANGQAGSSKPSGQSWAMISRFDPNCTAIDSAKRGELLDYGRWRRTTDGFSSKLAALIDRADGDGVGSSVDSEGQLIHVAIACGS
jgi:hypothetical protein